MVVQHNMSALFTSNQLGQISGIQQKTTEKLSSGYRVNRAADDAAGLTISEKMRWQVRGLNKASQNIQDGASFVQVADGALDEVEAMLQRINELCVQAANDTNTPSDRAAIQREISQVRTEMQRIFDDTEFNTLPVFTRKMDYTDYDGSGNVTNTGSEYIKDNNYGLMQLFDADKITQASNLADTVTFSGTGWVSSGNQAPLFDVTHTAITYDSNGVETSRTTTNTTQQSNWIPGLASAVSWDTLEPMPNGQYHSPETGLAYHMDSPTTLRCTRAESGGLTDDILTFKIVDGKHEFVSNVSTHYPDVYHANPSRIDTYTVSRDYAGSGGSYIQNDSYACAFIDFSDLGTKYDKENLYGLGFASTCSHGCGRYYSVKFVDGTANDWDQSGTIQTTSNGLKYKETIGSSYLLELDVSSVTAGSQITAAITDAATRSTTFDNHWEQYAYNTSNPNRLYLYENTSNIYSGRGSTWEPAARNENGQQEDLNYSIPTADGLRKYEEDNALHIQAGALGGQDIIILRPVMSTDVLGVSNIRTDDFEAASSGIAQVANALQYVNEKRSYLGALQNRLEHALSIDQNTSENSQAAESRIRDTDMAKEMVSFAAQNIIQQAGQSMLSQTNSSMEHILSLIQ